MIRTVLRILVGIPLAFGFVTIVTVGVAAVAIFCLLAPIAQGAYNDWRAR